MSDVPTPAATAPAPAPAPAAPRDPAPPGPKVLVAVWGALVALVLGSLGLSRLGRPGLAIALVAVATGAKLLLVARSYMDLAREPRWVAAILLAALAFIVLLLLLAAPDVALRVTG